MAHYTRGIEGNQAAPAGGLGASSEHEAPFARDNTKEAKFWVSHRMGPFLIHRNDGPCEPQPYDNAGYGNNFEKLIDQGFGLCPKCMRRET